jgi:putative ATPase
MFELTFSLAMTANQKNDRLRVDTLRPLLLRTQIVYDRAGDKHYDTISAFIKSMRGSGTLFMKFTLTQILTLRYITLPG